MISLRIYMSESTDGGIIWSYGQATQLLNPNSGGLHFIFNVARQRTVFFSVLSLRLFPFPESSTDFLSSKKSSLCDHLLRFFYLSLSSISDKIAATFSVSRSPLL